MIKNLTTILLVVLLGINHAQAQQTPPRNWQECHGLAPLGFPRATIAQGAPICRHGYALLYDMTARATPWVVYTLRADHTLACLPRQDQFEADQSLPRGSRAEVTDYRRSGYDMGHLAPNADMSWDPLVQRESFLLTNMAPQLPGLNRGLWRELEAAVRAWAYASQSGLLIYVGSIYKMGDPVLGSGVTVPRGFYKIVTDLSTGETLAFLMPHQARLPQDIQEVQSTVAEIEQISGIQFPVRDRKDVRRAVWPVNTRGLLAARQAQCRR